MATAPFLASAVAAPKTSRRAEILERYAALGRQSDRQVLGVGAGADGHAVREAYRRLARRFHPDALDADSRDLVALSQAIFVRVTEAYHALAAERPEPAPVAPRPDLRPIAFDRRGVPGAPRPTARPSASRPAPAATPRESPPSRSRPARVVGAVSPAAPPAQPAVDEAIAEARRRLEEGDAREAVGLLHGVLTRCGDEDGRRVRLLLARGYVREPQWRRYAAAQLRSLIAERPDDAEALALLGTVYRREGLLARAESLLKRALAADPRLGETRSALRAVQAERAEGRAARSAPTSPSSTLWKRMFRRKA
jgi:hypothetical protein